MTLFLPVFVVFCGTFGLFEEKRKQWSMLQQQRVSCVMNLTFADLQTGRFNKMSHRSGHYSYFSLLPMKLLCLMERQHTAHITLTHRWRVLRPLQPQGHHVTRNIDTTPTAARPHMPGPGPAGVKNVKHAFTLCCEEKSQDALLSL